MTIRFLKPALKTKLAIISNLVFVVCCDSAILKVPVDYNLIQSAIDSAFEGDTVLLANGIYQGEGNRDLDFSGKNLVVLSENGSDSTIIDCGGSYSNRHRAFNFHSKEIATSVLKGITFQNGFAPEDSNFGNFSAGGAIVCTDSSSPTILECNFRNNNSEKYGGAVAAYESRPTFENCVFKSNICDYGGGAIYLARWQNTNLNPPLVPIEILSCTFDSNSSPSGGAIWAPLALLQITNCVFENNWGADGGAIRNCNTLDSCIFEANSASTSGGAISEVSLVRHCSFIDNNSLLYGGAISSTTTVDSSHFQGNSAVYGGAIHRVGSLKNSTLQNCTAQVGGAVNGIGTETILNCKLFNNSADSGGAVSGVRYINSSTIYQNRALFGGGVQNVDSVKFSKIRDNSANYGGAIGLTNTFSFISRFNTIVSNSAEFGSAVSCVRSFPFFQYTIIAFGNVGMAAHTADDYSIVRIRCSDVYGNVGGDFVGPIAGLENQDNNFSLDPMFCPDTLGQYAIASISHCAPLNNACFQNIGGLPIVEPCDACCIGIRGDFNNDSRYNANILDLTAAVDFIFRNGPTPECDEESDINGDGASADLLDLTYIIDYIFRSGPNAAPCLFARNY